MICWQHLYLLFFISACGGSGGSSSVLVAEKVEAYEVHASTQTLH